MVKAIANYFSVLLMLEWPLVDSVLPLTLLHLVLHLCTHPRISILDEASQGLYPRRSQLFKHLQRRYLSSSA